MQSMEDWMIQAVITCAIILVGPALVGLFDIVLAIYLLARLKKQVPTPVLGMGIATAFGFAGFLWENFIESPSLELRFVPLVITICTFPLYALILLVRRLVRSKKNLWNWTEVVVLVPVSVFALALLVPWTLAGVEEGSKLAKEVGFHAKRTNSEKETGMASVPKMIADYFRHSSL